MIENYFFTLSLASNCFVTLFMTLYYFTTSVQCFASNFTIKMRDKNEYNVSRTHVIAWWVLISGGLDGIGHKTQNGSDPQ